MVLDRTIVLDKLKELLDAERYQHSLRVEENALKLARIHCASKTSASLAALLHDAARRYSRTEMLNQAKKEGLNIDPIQKKEPKLLHAALSAQIAAKTFGVSSPAVLNAIRKHTLGTPNMTKLEKIIYLADHLEEGRSYPGIEKLRQLAAKDLDQAIYASTNIMLQYLLENNLPIHPGTIATRNYYLL
jgi:predicted HD superfamily hydrolase involved in NAD metabolism